MADLGTWFDIGTSAIIGTKPTSTDGGVYGYPVATTLSPMCIPCPPMEYGYLTTVNWPTIPNGFNLRRTPILEFNTAVDGVLETRPTAMLIGKSLVHLPVNQPSIEWLVPAGVPLEILVYGGAIKRSEVWGPYNITPGVALELTATFPNAQVSVPYSHDIVVTGGVAPVIASYSGEIPPGMDFIDGELSGTPTTAGTWSFCITITDPRGIVRYKQTSITVDP